MKKLIGALAVSVLLAGAVFAQVADDDFFVSFDEDFSNAISEEEPAAGGGNTNILQGIWIEATSETGAIIRDIASGEKKGYEIDNNHFKSNANWWFWGDIKKFHLDAEVSVWDFDKTMYQSDSFAANIPTVTIGDGLQSLATMLWSPLYNGNDDGVGSLNKMGFNISTPIFNVRLGYGSLQKNGMSQFAGIYNVIDQWLDVGKGYTEITNGKDWQKFGDFKLNTVAAFSMMRGTYGMYDIVDLKYSDNYEAALTFGSTTTEEQLFMYNKQNVNAASLYLSAQPVDFLKLEAHGLTSFGTDIDYGKNALAFAGRVSYLGDGEWLKVVLKESYAGQDVNSVWGSDGQSYDDINADTLTTKLDAAWNYKDFLSIGLDETLTLNDVDDLSNGLMNIRTQPMIDYDLEPITDLGIKFCTYGVLNMDRLATATSADRNFITSFDEAGIEVTLTDLGIKKLTADYAISFDYKDWTSGNTYSISNTYNSIMLNADINERLNVHAGALIRTQTEDDATFVPFGFAFGAKVTKVPLPGKPSFWAHFAYGMDPYSENNYSLYRADNWMNKAPHRTYLLDDLYEDYTKSEISFGLIWDIQ